MYYCYSGFRSYLIKILAKKKYREWSPLVCGSLPLSECVYCAQCTVNKITTSRTLDRLNGMRFVGYFFLFNSPWHIYNILCYRRTNAVGIFLCSNFHFIFLFKNLSGDCSEVILFLETLQLLVVFLYIPIRVSYFYNL